MRSKFINLINHITNVIEELETYGLYCGFIELSRIVRVAERFILNIYKIGNMNGFYEPSNLQ